MTHPRTEARRQKAARRALARGAAYRLLSQALVYPSVEAVQALRESDVPQAVEFSELLSRRVTPLLAALNEHLQATDAVQLAAQHRRLFSHVIATDCPPCETFYTARHVFQETEDLSDISGFFRAFGLEMAENERLDHISVELEFVHILATKEAYALTHHGSAKARFCRETQRKFMADHVGRWATLFARQLGQKAKGGYYGCVASLLAAFLQAEMEFLRVKPDEGLASQQCRQLAQEDLSCPLAEQGPLGVGTCE